METIYEFTFRNIEGDLHESQEFNTKKEALDSIKEIQDNDGVIIETWIYKNGNFKGRFNY